MDIRNIAIVAHVDHGKTTLVDGLLKQSNLFRDNSEQMAEELIMDNNQQEKDRGITIFAKNASIQYKDTKINIIDTPGHADFSGEVERTLNMADGVLLLVDAQEGVMPQTKYVLKKAIELDLKVIVIINKIDKPNARIDYVLKNIEDLFLDLSLDLDKGDSYLEYPIMYAIGRDQKVWKNMPTNLNEDTDLQQLLDLIIEYIPAPTPTEDDLKLVITSIYADSHLGRYAIGRIIGGEITAKQKIALIDNDGHTLHNVDHLYVYKGLDLTEVGSVSAGEIVAITGIDGFNIGDTISNIENPKKIETIEIEQPTLRMYIGANTSPFAGNEGKYVTSRQLFNRIQKELETNVALKFELMDNGDYIIAGRGELHLSVFLETLRKEGFELEVGKPDVITKTIDGKKQEPFEQLFINLEEEFVNSIIQEVSQRKGILQSQVQNNDGSYELEFIIPSRGLIGFRSVALTLSKGTAVTNTLFYKYDDIAGSIENIRKGALISIDDGQSRAYALDNAQKRGQLLIGPAEKVYKGMVVGFNSRSEDLELSVTKTKQKTNIRASGHDDNIILTPPLQLSLEKYIDVLQDDELLEVTPTSLRLRKKILDPTARKRAKKR